MEKLTFRYKCTNFKNYKTVHRFNFFAQQIEDVTNAYNKNKEESGLLPVAELGTALRMLGHVLDKEG